MYKSGDAAMEAIAGKETSPYLVNALRYPQAAQQGSRAVRLCKSAEIKEVRFLFSLFLFLHLILLFQIMDYAELLWRRAKQREASERYNAEIRLVEEARARRDRSRSRSPASRRPMMCRNPEEAEADDSWCDD